MEIIEIMEKSWNLFWSWKKLWNFQILPNIYGKVMELFNIGYSNMFEINFLYLQSLICNKNCYMHRLIITPIVVMEIL